MDELKVKKIAEYTNEEIEAFGAAKPDETLDFSYPEGLFRMANSLTFLPDTKSRVQAVNGIMQAIKIG